MIVRSSGASFTSHRQFRWLAKVHTTRINLVVVKAQSGRAVKLGALGLNAVDAVDAKVVSNHH
jgi:hypothetical protein